ncbi:SCO family protein [Rufibacter glacialis]|uniref:SCO family protein n=1 Tax=Rufibacter glacialis TaxID=1259555 RepID=A0A5M8Q6V8_9BACT|nr:SCO family protein [Rufibacter glacialis]KAA6430801.1 SCO family protein [Rufibacter glacialis]GGK86832.1 SCO family protein [Rufibacter glacialis]
MKRSFLALCLGMALATACTAPPESKQLPILGPREPKVTVVDGKPQVDTVYHAIPDFAFVDQDSQKVTQETVAGKIYVADFFFTSCPSICPKMKSQMLRVYEKYKDNPRVTLLSHSIDPTHDTVAVLRDYAQRLGVKSASWHFLTGDRDTILDMAQKHYFTTAMVDKAMPGGFEHSGAFLLVDEQRRLRGHYDGTKAEDVDKLLQDMDVLLAETKK